MSKIIERHPLLETVLQHQRWSEKSADVEDGGALELVVLKHAERAVGLGKAHPERMGADGNFAGDFEKLLTVRARVGGHAAQLALVEKMALVVERGDRAQVNTGDRENSAAVECLQCRRHQLAGRGEQDRRVELVWRGPPRRADPIGAQRLGEFLMAPAAAHHEHAASPMLQHLDRDMRRAAEAVKADGRARPNLRALDRAKADYPRAQKRRGGLVAERVGQRVGKIFAHDHELGIATVVVVAGETSAGAEIFAPAPAIGALAAGLAQPGDANARALSEARAAGAASRDGSDDFMAGDDARMARRKVALGDVEIGAAYTAGLDANENFARPRLGVWKLDRAQRLGLDRGGRVYGHRFHGHPAGEGIKTQGPE